MNQVIAKLSHERNSRGLLASSAALMGVILVLVFGYVFLIPGQVEGQALSLTASCPGCDGTLTVWDQARSESVGSLPCSSCGHEVEENLEHLGVLEALVMGSGLLFSLAVLSSLLARAWRRMLGLLLQGAVYLSLLELGTALLLFNHAQLTVLCCTRGG